MELRLLGPLELLDDEGAHIELRGAKPNALVALLGLRVGEVVSTGRIIEELWGEQEVRDPLNGVQVVVSKIRRAFQSHPGFEDHPVVTTTTAGYRLDVEPDVVDAVRFDRLVQEGRRLLDEGSTAAAATTLRSALELWRGTALEDFDDGFARGDRVRLDELRATALEWRIDAELALGQHEQLVAELGLLTAQHPLREKLRGQQMLALYRAGRHGEALRAYQKARTVLAEELGLEPGPELQRLEAGILAVDPALDLVTTPSGGGGAPLPPPSGGYLPTPISSFVGRTDEIASLVPQVRTNRLVTIVGPGGAGKSRLALEVARLSAGEFAGGAWFVELAPLRDPADVASTIAVVLGLDDPRRLERFVANQAILLVVDNCEHVVEEAATVIARILEAGPAVHVLATSREHLGVVGEMRWELPPLHAHDATSLFVDRAGSGGRATAEHEIPLVQQICERLDGLPLAVELAAARTRSLSLDDIVERIDDRFRLLSVGERTAEPRQQTLRGVVDWSYDLLFADEQRVLRRLSVFVGGFDLRAAETVCATDDVAAADVVDILGHLVDKSLVSVVSREGEARYRLLQTLVDYGRMRLAESGEQADAADRHLQWMIEFAASAEPGLRGHQQLRWVRRVGLEVDNARAALQWALERGLHHDAVALAAGLAYGWYITGTIHEGQAFITRALSQGEGSLEHRAVALAWGGWLKQIGSGATSDAIEYTEEAVRISRAASSRAFGVAATLASLMRAYRAQTLEATELIEEAASMLAASPDRWSQSYVDWARSGLALKSGNAVRTADLLRASIAGFAEEGDDYGRAIASIRLGELAELRGDYDEAIEATRFAYDVIMSTGPGANVSILATRLGNLAALQGRFDDSASWHETALSRARRYGFPGPAAQAVSGMAVTAALRGNLDEAEALHREALAAYESVGSVEGAAFSHACLGFLASRRGDTAGAIGLHRRSLSEAMLGSERRAMALAVAGLAVAHAVDGNHHDAAMLLGVTADLRGVGPTMAPWVLTEMEQVEASSRAAMGDDAYCAAYDSGRARAGEILDRLASDVETVSL